MSAEKVDKAERVDKAEQSAFESDSKEELLENVSTNEQEKRETEAGIAQNSSGEIESSDTEEDEDSSGESVSLDDLLEEINDMYEDSDEESETDEGLEEEEEEGTEAEDLSEYMLKLQEKYMVDKKLDAKHLNKINKMIEEVPHQIYAIEVYVSNIRTFDGFSGHWVRIKVFDLPCFEINPCNKVETRPSLYPNQSTIESRGSGITHPNYENELEEIEEQEETEETPAPTIDMSDVEESNENQPEFDLPESSERETMSKFDPDENALWSMVNLRIESKIHEFEEDVSLEEDEEWEGNRRPLGSSRLDEKVWVIKEPIENGKTVMFPMTSVQMIHKMQRQPIQIFVMSTSGREAAASLQLDGLLEAVVRASNGPPYPITSAQKFDVLANGPFSAKVRGVVKLIAIGPQHISQMSSGDNPNEKMSHPRRKEVHPMSNGNMDIQFKPSILTGPQRFTLYDVVKNIRNRRMAKKSDLPPKPEPKKYFTENLVFNREANTVVRAPKKTSAELRAEIDRYLVLNKSMADKKVEAELTEDTGSEEEEFEEGWRKFEKRNDEDENSEGEDDELEDGMEDGVETNSERVETVFRSLLETYGHRQPANPFTHFRG